MICCEWIGKLFCGLIAGYWLGYLALIEGKLLVEGLEGRKGMPDLLGGGGVLIR